MGMFSEVAADGEATRLEKVLKTAMTNGWNPDVPRFAKLMIYPLYIEAIGETWGSKKEDPQIVKFYENLK